MTSAVHDNDHWEDALIGIGLSDERPASAPTLSLLFANALYPDFEALASEAYRRSGAAILVGCTGRGVIGGDTEVEGRPALAILNLTLPGAELFPKHVESKDFADLKSLDDWHRALGVPPDGVNAWLVIADPFTFDAVSFVRGLEAAYPGQPIAGGLASGLVYGSWTWLMLNDRPYDSGAIVVGIGGDYTVRSIVAEGTVPIGSPGTVTGAEQNMVQTIEGRPAAEVMRATIRALDEERQWEAQESLLVAVPSEDEPETQLIRRVIGSDRRRGTMWLDAAPQLGQPIQFHLNDAEKADTEWRRALARARDELRGAEVAGALLCSSTGRGIELFHVPDHDVQAVLEVFEGLPLGGFFSTGEIAAAGARTLVHGSTAALAFFVKK